MLDSTFLLWAVSAACAIWAGLAVWIVAGRIHYDRSRGRTAGDAALLASGALSASRCSWRRLWRAAGSTNRSASAIAARELVRRDSARIVGAASGRRFSRTHALRVLVRGEFSHAFEELRAARADGDPDVVEATVAIAGEASTREADAFLLDILLAGDHPRSRAADQLVPRVYRLEPRLLDLAAHPDAAVRYWSLMLLAESSPTPSILAAALVAGGDPDGQVRGAAARVLGSYRSVDVLLVLHRLLADDVFFVRAHAARATAECGAHHLAAAVAQLLTDSSWWVRAAAKESLIGLGDDGLEAATAMLDSPDGFARDGAGEVILAYERTLTAGEVSTALLERAAG